MRCPRPPTFTTVVTVAAFSLLVAACGSNSPSSSSTSTPSSSSGHPAQGQTLQAAVNFADCMRSHGVSNFPDPTSDPHAFKQAFETKAPAFQSAETACGHLLPQRRQSQSPANSHAQVTAALAFAHCIRSHGFPNFPDPTSSGDLTHQMVASAGIDLHQPAILQAGDACVGVTHGFITRSNVARFVAGQ